MLTQSPLIKKSRSKSLSLQSRKCEFIAPGTQKKQVSNNEEENHELSKQEEEEHEEQPNQETDTHREP